MNTLSAVADLLVMTVPFSPVPLEFGIVVLVLGLAYLGARDVVRNLE